MVLGDVIRVEAGPVERLDDLQPLLIVVAQRQVVAVEVIENTEFQAHADVARSKCARGSLCDDFASGGALPVNTA